MTLQNIAVIRLASQQIVSTTFKTPKDIVDWMGAMQAQDYAMAKWGIGMRLPQSTRQDVEKAIDTGKIIRTHVLRPTWHFVSPEDIYWMLELTAPRLKRSMRSRDKELGLTETLYTKSNSIIEKALEKDTYLTREELMIKLQKAKIPTHDYRSGHLMFRAELDGIACGGAAKNKKQTYALLSKRVKRTTALNKDEALAKLARRYFSSHCPATLKDFIWWSGLSVKDAQNGLDLVKPHFISEIIGAETYWLSNSFAKFSTSKASAHLLPAFDEFTISYKDRSATLPLGHQKKAFTSNGIFKPVVIVNGEGIGLWKRILKKEKVIIETELFKKPTVAVKDLIKKAGERYGRYLEMPAEIHFR